MIALQVGGIEDHIHALIIAPPNFAACEISQILKGETSRWIHKEFPSLRDFGWRDGYGAFTVSKSNIQSVRHYSMNEREHLRKKSFQEEYLELLKKNDVDYDARYLWGQRSSKFGLAFQGSMMAEPVLFANV